MCDRKSYLCVCVLVGGRRRRGPKGEKAFQALARANVTFCGQNMRRRRPTANFSPLPVLGEVKHFMATKSFSLTFR